MATQKQKEKKKKEREKIAKQRVLQRREAMRKFRKEEEVKAKLEKDMSPRLKPILNDPLMQEIREKNKQARLNEQIEKNMQLLEALEQEYDAEQALRNEVNSDLESEGHMTMKDKLDALHKKALAIQEAKSAEEKVVEETPVEA